MTLKSITLLISILIFSFVTSCSRQEANNNTNKSDSIKTLSLSENQKKVLAGAKECLEAGFKYDNEMAYHVLKYRDGEYTGSEVYPNGDLEPGLGVCTEVTIRALRRGGVCDLQKEIHEDITANPDDYPLSRWGAKKPDANIDHRRVPNQLVWFKKYWQEVTSPLHESSTRQSRRPSPLHMERGEYMPGDVVVWDMNGDGWADHIGIISDKFESGRPLVIHNFPSPGFVAEEDVLNRWEIAGVFRVK